MLFINIYLYTKKKDKRNNYIEVLIFCFIHTLIIKTYLRPYVFRVKGF